MPSEAKFSPSFHEVSPATSSVAFVLPDFFSDREGLAVCERDRGKCLRQSGDASERGKESEKMSSTMLFS